MKTKILLVLFIACFQSYVFSKGKTDEKELITTGLDLVAKTTLLRLKVRSIL
jgi:hypothetical protein